MSSWPGSSSMVKASPKASTFHFSSDGIFPLPTTIHTCHHCGELGHLGLDSLTPLFVFLICVSLLVTLLGRVLDI